MWMVGKDFVVYVSIGQPDSELLSNSMKVSRGGIIIKSHCCDVDTYNRKVGALSAKCASLIYYAQHCNIRLAVAKKLGEFTVQFRAVQGTYQWDTTVLCISHN